MKTFFDEAGIKISDEQLNMFSAYKDLLKTYNDRFNLTAITEDEEIIKKHFIDSVLYCDKLKGKTLIDVGSGGGFPAVPIKIMRPDIEVTMLEATGKKCMFLSEVVKELNLTGVTVINNRAEELAKDIKYRESFDICTARVVARLNTLSEYCMPFVKPGGSFIAFKADAEEEIKEAMDAVKILGGKLKGTVSFDLFGNKRTVIVINKVQKTPEKYPRGNGKERKKPL